MPQYLLSLAWQVLCLSFDVILVELRVRLQLEAFNEPFHLNKLRVNRAVKNTPPHWVSSYKRHEAKVEHEKELEKEKLELEEIV